MIKSSSLFLSKSVVIKNKLISDSKSLASQIGLVKAIKDHNLSTHKFSWQY